VVANRSSDIQIQDAASSIYIFSKYKVPTWLMKFKTQEHPSSLLVGNGKQMLLGHKMYRSYSKSSLSWSSYRAQVVNYPSNSEKQLISKALNLVKFIKTKQKKNISSNINSTLQRNFLQRFKRSSIKLKNGTSGHVNTLASFIIN